jgi:hypothetical protein
VEHSIMKRAWPYAVALAVVVTGCYLALTPLLRSLSPGATTSSHSIANTRTSATIGQSTVPTIDSPQSNKVSSKFVTGLHSKKKAKKKATATTTRNTTTTRSTDTTGFARGNSSNTQTPTKTPTTVKTKPKPAKKGSGTVSGSVDQSTGGGLAQNGSGDATVGGGTQSDPAAN